MLHEGSGQRRPTQQYRVLLRQAEAVQFGEVVLHHERGLHQQTRHADGICLAGFGGVDDGLDRLFDADVDDGVAVVADDDVDEILADVVDVPPHRGEHQGALSAAALDLVDVRFQMGDSGFHDLGGLEHERELHLSGTKEFADHLHAGQQVLVDDLEGSLAGQGLVQVSLEPLCFPVDDAALQPLRQR